MISSSHLCGILSISLRTVLFKLNLLEITTSMTEKKCYLVHLINHVRINLPHNEITTIGRSLETKLEDIYVSKKQLECVANTETCTVKVKPVGKSICGVDGYAVVKDKTYILGPGHVVELRLGFHPFEIVFESPEEKRLKHTAKKPKMDVENGIADNFVFSENGKWEVIDHKELLIYTPENIQSRAKIAAFDVDGTIIKTKSGARFPKDGDDWVLNYGDIPTKLQKLYRDNFKIVFFTNQSGIGKDSSRIKDFKRKIENIIKNISVPIQVFIALGKTKYRKPVTGMWDILKNQKNENIDIDLTESFYVGDAAGREKNWAPKKPKDHSNADRLFALNICLKFFTPEEYFQKSRPVPFTMPEFDPRNISDFKGTLPNVENYAMPNVILMVGGPGSGKSHFCKLFIATKSYVHINRDTVGSWQKCVKLLEEALQKKKNCVIDNTNTDKESRKRYIDVAKQFKVPCRCFVMNTFYQQCKHNNKFRELTDKSHVPVSEIIINNLKKNYQKPELEEGYDEIIEVPFVPHFNSSEDEQLYKMFLLEK